MKETWRWFGPSDPISIAQVRQTGASGVVSALHHVPPGQVWTKEEVRKHQALIERTGRGEATGLAWDVVESLPVSEAIKRQDGDWRAHIEAYSQSLRNLAACGVKTVCYNFMPVLDWTRTDLGFALPDGARALRFDMVDFAAFDIHVLARPDAVLDYQEEARQAAARRYSGMKEDDIRRLVANVIAGLPGAEASYSLSGLRAELDRYEGMSDERIRKNLADFLEQVVPVAEQAGVRLCCHPDDPPFPLLGLPRIISTENDCKWLVDAVDRPANGITLCSGSLGARHDVDLPGMMKRLGSRVHFLHLRNVRKESGALHGSFHEADHLDGDTDMPMLVRAVLDEEEKRRQAGRTDWSIPFRPDHGHEILSDLEADGRPGYPLIGRTIGLSELRGLIRGLQFGRSQKNAYPSH